MNLLIVEDEGPKLDAIVSVVSQPFSWASLRTARSVRSARTCLDEYLPDLLILDMSLPTFDISPGEPGGRPQGEGGIEVLRHLEMKEYIIPTIVVTGYDAFKRKDGQRISFERLGKELEHNFPGLFHGLVHFDPIRGIWGEMLVQLVANVLKVKK